MSILAAWIVLALCLKILGIVALMRILARRLNDQLGALLGAWLLVQLGIVALMLILSWDRLLIGPALWISLGLFSLSLVAYDSVESSKTASAAGIPRARFEHAEKVAILAVCATAALLFYRSLYFFDVTWDAMTYETTRVYLWNQLHSLFGALPTQQVNIFANEWNGELNAAFYSILTHNDQATSFGNVEVWLVSAFTYTWLAETFSLKRSLSAVVGLMLATTPVMLGLSATVKGDLMACVAFAMAIGWIARIESLNRPDLCFVLAAGSLGLSAGAKIVALPAVPLLFLAAIMALLSAGSTFGKLVVPILAAAAIFSVGAARYVANAFQYGHFIERFPGETGRASFANLLPNLKGILQGVGGILTSGIGSPPVWVLNLGMGAAGMVVAICVALAWVPRRPAMPRTSRLIVAGLVVSFLLVAIAVPWEPWSFRYFAPWLYVASAFFLAHTLKSVSRSFTLAIAMLSVALAALHLSLVFRPGEALPGATVAISFATARNETQIQRKLAFHPYLFGDGGQLGRLEIQKPGKSILIYNRVNGAVAPFFGENEGNQVTLTDGPESLVKEASRKQYAWVVVSGPRLPSENETIWNSLASRGYVVAVDCEFWRIARLSSAAD